MWFNNNYNLVRIIRIYEYQSAGQLPGLRAGWSDMILWDPCVLFSIEDNLLKGK